MFSRFQDYKLLESVTECYRELQSVIECYRVLKIVTECCRVLQSVTECYRVLQSVTLCYRVLQSVTGYYRVLQGPVLKIAAYGAHVRGTKASLGGPKSWWTRKLISFESWENQSVEMTKQCRGRQKLIRTGKLSVLHWHCHKIPISVICCICHAFWGDQMDPKSVCGGPSSILRTGLQGVTECYIVLQSVT